MKQFTRCTSCRQWYLRTATALVEIHQGEARRHTTLWCLACITAAEQRSLPPGVPPATGLASPLLTDLGLSTHTIGKADSPLLAPGDDFQHCMQEHLRLMDRALQEEDDVLVPLLDAFLQRCQRLQEDIDTPERLQRLKGCVHYWQTFLRTLRLS